MKWEQHKELFAWDGSLLDIYVLDTTMSDWQRLLDALRASSYELRYKVDGETIAKIPEQIEAIFARHLEADVSLTIDAPQLWIGCHFFTPDEIEFDLDPRAIDGQPRLDRLVHFIAMLRDALNKEVLLTPESLSTRPLWQFNV